jgi:hypothetical protein
MPVDRTSHLVAPVASTDTNKRRPFYRSFIHFLFSNLGLVILIVAYTVGGAFLFILLEQYIELQDCQQGNCKHFFQFSILFISIFSEYKVQENISITNISESMYNDVVLSDGNTTDLYAKMVYYMNNFTLDVYQRRLNYRYVGQDCITGSEWNFPSALLFTITVVTTIGYGYVTPTSW